MHSLKEFIQKPSMLGLLFYLIIFQEPLKEVAPVLGYLDEIIALAALPLYIWQAKKWGGSLIPRNICPYLLLIFIVAGLSGSLINMYQPFFTVALPQAFLSIKFWLALYTGSVLFKNIDLKVHADSIYYHIRILVVLFVFCFIVDNILAIFQSSIFYADIRYGLRSTQLFYGHPTTFASVCGFLCTLLVMLRNYVNKTDYWLAAISILIVSTLRVKAIGVVLVFVLLYYWLCVKKWELSLQMVAGAMIVVLLVAKRQIEFYFFSNIIDDSARYQLTKVALEIIGDYFPLGTGFGTFGSYMSSVSYSPVYNMYHINHVLGLTHDFRAFMCDTYWPMIAGETGIIGLLSILVLIALMLVSIYKFKDYNINFYACGLMIMSYMLISSTSESAFAHPNGLSFALLLGMLYGQKEGYFKDRTKKQVN